MALDFMGLWGTSTSTSPEPEKAERKKNDLKPEKLASCARDDVNRAAEAFERGKIADALECTFRAVEWLMIMAGQDDIKSAAIYNRLANAYKTGKKVSRTNEQPETEQLHIAI